MILRRFFHSDPVAASYLLGCGGQAAGAVVPPQPPQAARIRARNAGLTADAA